jgi:dCTP deaminase
MAGPMSVLTRDASLEEIESGRMVIAPFERDQIGVASIDLTLGDEMRVIEASDDPIDIREETDYRVHTTVGSLAEPYLLKPGVTIHGITREKISLPSDLCGFLEGRSRYARLGLMIHVTSAFVQPGVENRQVLELSNVSRQALLIHSGVRVCQLVVMRTEGAARYRGRFSDQDTI